MTKELLKKSAKDKKEKTAFWFTCGKKIEAENKKEATEIYNNLKK